MKKIVLEGREYLEIPDDLKRKKILILRLDDGLYLVGREERIQELVKRQVSYLVSKRTSGKPSRPKIVKSPERRPEKRTKEAVDRGYWVFDTESEAALFSRQHAAEFQMGEILGIRGFDGKFYAVRRRLYESLLPKVLDLLRQRSMTVEEIADRLKRDKSLVKAVLELAREDGLVIERAGGVYEYAG